MVRLQTELMQIVDRVGDAVKIRGIFVHLRQVERCLTDFPEVTKFQLVIERVEQRDRAVLKIEIPEKVEVATICEEIEKRFSEVCTVRLDKVECVPLGVIPADAKILSDQRKWE